MDVALSHHSRLPKPLGICRTGSDTDISHVCLKAVSVDMLCAMCLVDFTLLSLDSYQRARACALSRCHDALFACECIWRVFVAQVPGHVHDQRARVYDRVSCQCFGS